MFNWGKNKEANQAAKYMSIAGGILMSLSGFFGLINLNIPILSLQNNLILDFLSLFAGVLIVGLQLNKLPQYLVFPLKINFNKGIVFILIGIILIKSGIGSLLVLISGIIYIWPVIEKKLM